MSQRKPKSKGKRKTLKTSLQKLSNKHLNKLAKQGKLKKTQNKGKVLGIIRDRTEKGKPEDQKHANQPPKEEDIPLQEADYEYFATSDRDFSFLSGVDTPTPRKRKRGKKDKDENEHTYEKVPRKIMGNQDAGMKSLLPIKSKEHGIQKRMIQEDAPEMEGEQHEEEDGDGVSSEQAQTAEPLPELSMVELYAERHIRLADAKQQIATLSTAILEDPDENVGKLKSLRLLLELDDPFIGISVRKLTLLSLLEIFKDIIPSYRIRQLSDKEKSQAMKKETKKLNDLEDALLSNYKLYLEFLEAQAKGKPIKARDQENKKRGKYIDSQDLSKVLRQSLILLAVRCLCELLLAHPHFNYRTNIVSLVIPFMDSANPELSDMVCSYIKRIFKEDKSGELTLEVTRLIGRLIKSHNFRVQAKVLDTFLSLRIKEVDRGGEEEKKEKAGERRKKFKTQSKRDKKRKKQMKHLEKELQEAAAEVDKKHRIKLHTEVINMVFLTYFRILKQSRHSPLLSTVLAGLAKFAHLINVEFFDDLFAVLKELVLSEELTFLQSLHCVQTAFTILSGQGSALNIDPFLFYNHLYKSLLQLSAAGDTEPLITTLRCLDLLICKRRKQVSTPRMLAFMKRLSTIGLQQLSHGSLGLLSLSRTLLQGWSVCEVLLDTACEGGSGVFLPELDQPEHCNAHGTALYELHLLKRHYHPTVGRFCHHLLAGAPVQGHHQLPATLTRRSPEELVEEYDPTDMTFNPTIDKKPKANKKKNIPYHGIKQLCVMEETKSVLDSIDLDSCSQLDFWPVSSSQESGPL